MVKYFKEFLITSEPFIPEILSSALWKFDISGISEEVNCIKIFSYNLELTKSDLENELNNLVENNLLRTFEIQENTLLERNWNQEWENSREVIKVSDRIIIKPSFKEYKSKENEIVIIIDPKMSFGTGKHPTTKICIKLIEKYIKENDKVLDVGSGTGILSIAASKLGAKSVIAIDIDEWAYENGKENILINNVESKVDIRICELKDLEEINFDLIIANIQRNVLIELVNQIKNHIRERGTVILSGIIEDDINAILETYNSSGFEMIDKLIENEWVGLVFRNNSDKSI